MRFKVKTEEDIKYGTTREVTKFLYFPKVINGDGRWFEEATYEEIYNAKVDPTGGGDYYGIWEGVSWK